MAMLCISDLMSNPTSIAIFLVIGLHIGFFILESILWTSPKVMALFQNTTDEAQSTRVLALNQGFYNLGVAVMLGWLYWANNPPGISATLLFIIAMGIVGAITANWRIVFIQSLPAAVAFGLLNLAA